MVYECCLSGKLDLVQLIWSFSTNKEPRDINGSTPLHLSAEYGDLDIVKFFMNSGCDKEPRDANENTPLHRASAKGNSLVVKYLIQEDISKGK